MVNGTNYSIKKGRTLIGGTGYDILFTKKLGNMAVGESVYLNESGSPVEFLIVHKGNPSTSIYDSSCNGIWLLRKNAGATQMWNTSVIPTGGDYSTSAVNSYLQGTYLSSLDTAVQKGIIQVKIPYTNQGKTVNGLSTKVFLLSVMELGKDSFTSPVSVYDRADGVKLNYFIAGETAKAQEKRACTASSGEWWTRTAISYATIYESSSSGYIGSSDPKKSYNVRPAMILPSDTIVPSDGIITMQ